MDDKAGDLDFKWTSCAAKLQILTDQIENCRSLLHTVATETEMVNPISFISKSMVEVENVRQKSANFLNHAKATFEKLMEEYGKEEGTAAVSDDNIVAHDPGNRPPALTRNQKLFLLSLGPHQPILSNYPKNLEVLETNKHKQNKFSPIWFKQYQHLEYSVLKDAVFCLVCYLFPSGPGRCKADPAWTTIGVRQWPKMKSCGKQKKGKLEQHFSSEAHKAALSDYCHFINEDAHIDSVLSKIDSKETIKREQLRNFNNDAIKIMLDVTRTLARQGLAFRGHDDDKNGNFRQILELISRHNPVMKTWLHEANFKPYRASYLSSKSQNEFIDLLAAEVRESIVQEVNDAKMFTVMADTTPDVSHDDQLSIVVRYVNDAGIVSERLLDIIVATDKTGAGLASTILNCLNGHQVSTNNLIFQSYDYANSMSGSKQGTQKKLSELLERPIPYIPCQAHRFNTFGEHSCNASLIVTQMFDNLQSLYTFFSGSTKRFSYLREEISEIENSLHIVNLSKTRWTAQAQSLKAVWTSFEAVVEVLEKVIESHNFDNKTKATALSLKKAILNFDFIVCVVFMKNVMYKSKVLTELLESRELNVIDAAVAIRSTVISFESMLSDDDGMNNLIEAAKQFSSKLDVNAEDDFSRHHRKRKPPKKIDDNPESAATLPMEQFYRKEFKKVLNVLITETRENLSALIEIIKPLYSTFQIPFERKTCILENIKAALKFIPECPFPDSSSVHCQLETLADQCESGSVNNMADIMKVSEKFKRLLNEANFLCRLAMTAPVSVAENERNFSKLKFIKNYLRNTMTGSRLASLMLLHSEKDVTDTINLERLVKKWSVLKERKIRL